MIHEKAASSEMLDHVKSLAIGDGYAVQPTQWHHDGVQRASHVACVIETDSPYELRVKCADSGISFFEWAGDLATTLTSYGFTFMIGETEEGKSEEAPEEEGAPEESEEEIEKNENE